MCLEEWIIPLRCPIGIQYFSVTLHEFKNFGLTAPRVQISWVKVKGHSKEEGNEAADTLAGDEQNGGAKNVQDGAMMMDRLRNDGGEP